MFAYARPALAGFLAFCALSWGGTAEAGRLAMEVSGWANPPVGYLEFCRTYSDQCLPRGGEAARGFNETSWRDLEEVNTLVNRLVIPATDLDHYRREEVWTLPQSHGDCEDFVLLKRKWLLERGWPTGSLL